MNIEADLYDFSPIDIEKTLPSNWESVWFCFEHLPLNAPGFDIFTIDIDLLRTEWCLQTTDDFK